MDTNGREWGFPPSCQFAKFDAGFSGIELREGTRMGTNEDEWARMGFSPSCQFAKFDAGFFGIELREGTRIGANGANGHAFEPQRRQKRKGRPKQILCALRVFAVRS
jgi:hypothetical protein